MKRLTKRQQELLDMEELRKTVRRPVHDPEWERFDALICKQIKIAVGAHGVIEEIEYDSARYPDISTPRDASGTPVPNYSVTLSAGVGAGRFVMRGTKSFVFRIDLPIDEATTIFSDEVEAWWASCFASCTAAERVQETNKSLGPLP